ncbi:hypothetical protein HUR95_12065 [Caldalkalibacillus thermarum TA2.A1]|uniref:Uncharacterized protein n=1 Tax=Caldalkalibacillus thermarum (strain TA2.A1) TaxID=986075 RepID=A0A8X8L9M0_CALTT|nr:hypothetical protein [Caldalkalibacillus thermarum]QZT33053.1 hypothetical protein HUR95_12065 [Caldalkalibacillus thermarum TA2.A1]
MASNFVPEFLASGQEEEEVSWMVEVLSNGILPSTDGKAQHLNIKNE